MSSHRRRRIREKLFMEGSLRWPLLAVIIIGLFVEVSAHPLGNFTINHFARIESGRAFARIRYVVDFAEVPAFQESQKADLDSDGNLTEAELNAYLEIGRASCRERV